MLVPSYTCTYCVVDVTASGRESTKVHLMYSTTKRRHPSYWWSVRYYCFCLISVLTYFDMFVCRRPGEGHSRWHAVSSFINFDRIKGILEKGTEVELSLLGRVDVATVLLMP